MSIKRRGELEIIGYVTSADASLISQWPHCHSRREHGKTSSKRSGQSRAEVEADDDEPKAVVDEAGAPQNTSSQAVPGLVSVVQESPQGGKWFEDVFCGALGC